MGEKPPLKFLSLSFRHANSLRLVCDPVPEVLNKLDLLRHAELVESKRGYGGRHLSPLSVDQSRSNPWRTTDLP